MFVLEKEGELWLDILWDFRTAEQLWSWLLIASGPCNAWIPFNILNNAKWKRVSLENEWLVSYETAASKLLIRIYLSGGLVGVIPSNIKVSFFWVGWGGGGFRSKFLLNPGSHGNLWQLPSKVRSSPTLVSLDVVWSLSSFGRLAAGWLVPH